MKEDVRRSVATALACGVEPAMTLSVALAAEAPKTLDDGALFVESLRPFLDHLARTSTFPTSLAELEPELRLDAEIAKIRPDVGDHELRDHFVFRDLVGKKTFFQVAALAIAGLDLSRADADLLEHLGVNTQLADARIWPLSVVRRIGARRGMTSAILAGASLVLSPHMGPRPVGAFMRVLDRLSAGLARGASVEDQLARAVERGERIPGVGRPVLGPDERNAQVIALAHTHERARGASWQMALAVDEFFHEHKKQRINSAGLQGALMRDMGFSPAAASAFCLLYFMTPILAQAVVAEERLYARASAPSDR